MSKQYEQEQTTVKEKLDRLNESLIALDDKRENTEIFTEIVKKYTNITELNADILNELIDKIVIHECYYTAPEKKGGVKSRDSRVQQIDIHYNFLGKILSFNLAFDARFFFF